MSTIDIASYVLHTLFAGLWTGSVVFATLTLLPMARDGELAPGALSSAAGRLAWLSRTSALVLFLTGSHMAAARYTADTLTATTGGYLVLAMLGLWVVLIGTVEVGIARLRNGTGRDKVREPAREARRPFLLASVVAVLLLLVAGLLSARNAGFL